jgi:signal transduction histidine kinase
MFRSATAKLTLYYLAIVMAISLSFSVVIYHFAANEVRYGLNSQTQRIFRTFPVFNNNPYLRVRADDVSLAERHIFWRLVDFNVLVLISAGLLSYLLARRTLEPIEASHTRQKRFTADVSHELRTPLTSLKMSSEVAVMDKAASREELRSALTSNVEDAAKMELLIGSLLRLTKLDEDTGKLALSPLGSQPLIEAAVDQIRTQADAKRLKIENSAATATIMADADAFTQLLVILLDNAVKYSPAKATVTLSGRKKDSRYELSIADSGPGISAEALPHVFERFYRQDSARTSGSTEGYGLGLSIAKLIADRSDTHITLTSRPGKGTTAVVSLPLAGDKSN